MKRVTIDLQNIKYDVFIGSCLYNLKKYINKQKVLVITDENVKSLYFHKLTEILNIEYIFTLGSEPEKSKNLFFYEKCIKYALGNYLDKNTIVIALGGGAVSDFAGYFAATYKRGLELIIIPTTLLSHDSAVGGKNALNIDNTKNVIGSFYQPKVVLYHLPFLKTLSKQEILSGFGEIFKHDLLSDGYILQQFLIDYNSLTPLIYQDDLIKEIVYRAILVKKLYVEMDVYDNKGKRQFLNFGHSLGHALEITNSLSHGEAISMGICFSLFLSNNPFCLPFYKRLRSWGYFNNNIIFNIDEISNIIKNDKKNKQDKIKFIGLKEVGKPYEICINTNDFKTKLKEFLRMIKWK